MPGPTHVVALFQYHEIVVAGFLEFDAHAQAGESGSDDGDLGVLAHGNLVFLGADLALSVVVDAVMMTAGIHMYT